MRSLSRCILIASVACVAASCMNLAESALAKEGLEPIGEIHDIDKLITSSASRVAAALSHLEQHANDLRAETTGGVKEKEKPLADLEARIAEIKLILAFEAEQVTRLKKLKRPSDRLFVTFDRKASGKRYVLIRNGHIIAKSELFPLDVGEGHLLDTPRDHSIRR